MSENQIPEDDKKPYRSLLDRMQEQRKVSRTKAQVEWVKSLFNLPIQDIGKHDWDKAAPSTYSTIPPELSDELFDEAMERQVMFSGNKHTLTSTEIEAGGTEDGHRINDLLLESTIRSDEAINYYYFIFDLINSYSDGVAVAIDQYTTSSTNVNSFIGLVPNDAADKDNKIPDELKAIRKAVTVVDKLHNSITLRDLHVLQNIYKKQNGDDSIKDAKWYFNSMTGLEIAKIKNADGSYWMDQTREDLISVGVPDNLMGSEIVYNEYMKEIYDDKEICIIYGNLDGVYYFGAYPDVRIIRTEAPSDNGDERISFVAQLKVSGDVDLTKRVDGKLPYIALRNVITGGNSK